MVEMTMKRSQIRWILTTTTKTMPWRNRKRRKNNTASWSLYATGKVHLMALLLMKKMRP
jgi:hypothetical protein